MSTEKPKTWQPNQDKILRMEVIGKLPELIEDYKSAAADKKESKANDIRKIFGQLEPNDDYYNEFEKKLKELEIIKE